jgi:hypothetical protein
MKTIEEIASTIYQPIGMSCNEFAIKLAKEYAKQVLEEYTNRIVENAKVEYKRDLLTGEIDKESIISQLPEFLKEKGI